MFNNGTPGNQEAPHAVSEYRGKGQGHWPWRPTALWQVPSLPLTVVCSHALMHLIWKIEMTIIVLPRGVLGGLHESILHRMMPSTE